MSTLMEKWYLKTENATFGEVKGWTKECLASIISGVEYGGLTFQKNILMLLVQQVLEKQRPLLKLQRTAC